MTERAKVNFGIPQSYDEAVQRFPDDLSPIQEMMELKHLLKTSLLHTLPLRHRMLFVSSDSVKLMEEWSFRRDLDNVKTTGWDQFLPYNRVEPLSEVFKADELYRDLEVWKLKPAVDDDKFILVCVRASPGYVFSHPEYLMGFLTPKEYDLLIPPDSNSGPKNNP